MKQDISFGRTRYPVARIAMHRGLVRLNVGGEMPNAEDVLILCGPDGACVAGRYAGVLTDSAIDEPGEWKLIGRYRVGLTGIALSSLIDANDGKPGPVKGHDWGAIGLPNGPFTLVTPVEDGQAHGDDVAIARQSRGYAEYGKNPRLSVGPGDEVHVGGREGTVIAVDRRKRTAEIRFSGEAGTETERVDFDAVEELEMRQ